MRITDLKVDGFGVWSGLELSELSDQVNVFYGPNEAGKTTLMQFVRSMLYGFSPERTARYLPPVRGGQPGGSISAVAGQKSFAISRHPDEFGSLNHAAVISDHEHTVIDAQTLTSLLGEIDEPIFNNVFAFGLREIQELGTLSDTQAADELYNLALGLDRVSLSDVLAELETSRQRLLAPDDRPSQITQLLSQRERLRTEIDRLGQATVHYLNLIAERRAVDADIAQLEAENADWERQARELALARALSERWQRRATIDRELSGVAGLDTLPPNALSRFDRLVTRIAACRRRYKRIRSERGQIAEQIEQLGINEPLCREALRIEALGEQSQWIKSLSDQVDQLELDLLELESRRKSEQQWGNTTPSAPPLSQRRLEELRNVARVWRESQQRLAQLRDEHQQSQKAAAEQQQKLTSALGSAKDKNLTDQLAEAGELVSQLRKRVQLDERLDQMTRRESELESENDENLEQQIMPAWMLAGLGSLFVLGCALMLLFVAGLILPTSLSGSLDWTVGLFGTVFAGAAGIGKFMLDQKAVGQLDTSYQQLQLLSQQMKQARAERDELDQRLPKAGGPLVVRLQAAEKALSRLETLVPLDSQRETAERTTNQFAQETDRLQAQVRQSQKTWRRLLAESGLPADLHPRQLKEYWQGREKLQGVAKAIEDTQAALARRRGEYQAIVSRISKLSSEVGLSSRPEKPLDQLTLCLAELGRQQSLLKRREELMRQSIRCRQRLARVRQFADKLRDKRRQLLRAAGTGDEHEFRRRAQAQVAAERLHIERTQLAHEITTALTGNYGEEKLSEWLTAHPELGLLEARVAESRQGVAANLSQALERRGAMYQKLKILAEDRQLADQRIELGIVEKRLQEALDRWRVLTVCRVLLETVRQFYEREHQPQVLREASTYLGRLTGGRYVRVWTPLGEHALRVEDGNGKSLHVEVLSRGTREQLFLALRLALISSYARRGVNLPLVLDDVLVNFDLGRAKAAASVLRDFAKQEHQILIFTCHEHISRLFKNIKAEVRQLPDNSQVHLLEAEEPAKRIRRPRPEPVVELPVVELEVESLPEPEPPPAPEPEPLPEPELTLVPEPPAEPEPARTPVLDLQLLPIADDPEPESPPLPLEPLPELVPVAEEPPAIELVPLAELVPEPEPPVAAPVVVIPPPPPRPRRRLRREIERRHWSAEEFSGELSDRVRHGDAIEEISWESSTTVERIVEVIDDAERIERRV